MSRGDQEVARRADHPAAGLPTRGPDRLAALAALWQAIEDDADRSVRQMVEDGWSVEAASASYIAWITAHIRSAANFGAQLGAIVAGQRPAVIGDEEPFE